MPKLILSLFLVGISLQAWSQRQDHNWGLKYYGFSIHPKGDPQAHLMPYRFDDKGYLVANFGGILSYQYYLPSRIVSLKMAQGIYTDSGGLLSGHTHLGFRLQVFNSAKSEILFGFGPTWVYRKSWKIKPGYESTGLFREKNGVQYKFAWYGGEIEYNFRWNESWDLSAHILPGYPLVIGFGFGVRYWPK